MSELQQLQKRVNSQRKKESGRLPLKLAQEAECILKQKNVENEDAIFILLAAANYLNTFVKQSHDKHFEDNYFFKQELVDALKNVDRSLVKLGQEKNVLTAEIYGFQFSFHHVDFDNLKETADLEESHWSGIRLQPYALDIFKFALSLNDDEGEFVNQLKALADPMRLKILDSLIDQTRCACEFTADLPISQSTLSHHLSVLHKAGLITIEKEGVRSNVSINQEAFESCQKNLSKYQQKMKCLC